MDQCLFLGYVRMLVKHWPFDSRTLVGGSRRMCMETVSVSRSLDASRNAIKTVMADLQPFMTAAGFDKVTVDGEQFTIENSVGLLTIDLTLRLLDTDAALAYEQVEGIFESMETRYVIEERGGTASITATTEFAVDVSLVGPLLDSTVVARQRRTELRKQFDYLEATVDND